MAPPTAVETDAKPFSMDRQLSPPGPWCHTDGRGLGCTQFLLSFCWASCSPLTTHPPSWCCNSREDGAASLDGSRFNGHRFLRRLRCPVVVLLAAKKLLEELRCSATSIKPSDFQATSFTVISLLSLLLSLESCGLVCGLTSVSRDLAQGWFVS